MNTAAKTSSPHAPSRSQRDVFLREVLAYFRARSRALSARWLYDQRGSALFERITHTPEYYPTRTEIELLQTHATEFRTAIGAGRMLVEFGSGSCRKTPILIRALQPSRYLPIDISGEFLRASIVELQCHFPHLNVTPIVGDFSRHIDLPPCPRRTPIIGFFPGSTIGNFEPPAAVNLLRSMASTLGADAYLLIGMDSRKSLDILLPAYDDAEGVTAAFNQNLLKRINRELGANIPVEQFRHEARWNEARGRIEMHLVATDAVQFDIDGQTFGLEAGESLHTENSHKYDEREAGMLLRASGWEPVQMWSAPQGLFRLYLAVVSGSH